MLRNNTKFLKKKSADQESYIKESYLSKMGVKWRHSQVNNTDVYVTSIHTLQEILKEVL